MNFILKHKGNGPPDLIRVQRILQENNIHIIDGSLLPDMALLELIDGQLELLRGQLSDEWDIYPEKIYPLPNTRKRINN